MMRQLRGLPSDGNDHWTDDWLCSDTPAGNTDPAGNVQGLTVVVDEDGHEASLAGLISADPEVMLGPDHVERHGPRLGFLVKLIALGAPAPLHVHPTSEFTQRFELGREGQAECWVPLETRTPGGAPLHAGIGFRDGVSRRDLRSAITSQSTEAMHALLEDAIVEPGEAWLIQPGIPHYVGAEVLFIEIQQPSDLAVIPEHWTIGSGELDATLGLGWDRGLDAFDFDTQGADGASARARSARQRSVIVREHAGTRELDLLEPAAHPLFDVRRLEISDGLDVAAGQLSINVVTAGDGVVEGDWGSREIRRGQAFVMAAAVPHRFRAGTDPLRVHRCVGPSTPREAIR